MGLEPATSCETVPPILYAALFTASLIVLGVELLLRKDLCT